MLLLSDLKNYLQQQKSTNLRELQMYYKEDAVSIYNMLQHLILRGNVVENKLTPKCGSKCQQCDPIYTIQFIWQSAVRTKS